MKDLMKGVLLFVLLSLGGCYLPNDSIFLGGEQEVEVINDTDDVLTVYYPYRVSDFEVEQSCGWFGDSYWYTDKYFCSCEWEYENICDAVEYVEPGESLYIYVETSVWDGSIELEYQGVVKIFDVDIDILEEDEIRVSINDFVEPDELAVNGLE